MLSKFSRKRDESRRRLRSQRTRRSLFIESLERREVFSDAYAILAPGTPIDRLWPDAAGPNGGSSPFRLQNRWSATATNGGGLQQGDTTTLTWSIVDDGLSIPSAGYAGESTANSNLVAFLDGIYGAGPGGTDFTQRPWFPVMQQVFTNWSAQTGLDFVYVAYDDDAPFRDSPGILNVRADVRVGGHRIDGNFNILAYNYYPDVGDMVIDTADNFYFNTTSNSLGLRNVLAHELGHGIGLAHTCPVDQTKLMEPFVSYAFDGPQHDDLLGVHRMYGDRFEPSDTVARAYDFGSPGASTVSVADVSIDGTSDTDLYRFTMTAAGRASVLLRPTGQAYLEGPQNANGSCTAGTQFDSRIQNDLQVQLLDVDGSTVLATASVQPAGVNELLSNIILPAAGT
jgi:hypothetical protein